MKIYNLKYNVVFIVGMEYLWLQAVLVANFCGGEGDLKVAFL